MTGAIAMPLGAAYYTPSPPHFIPSCDVLRNSARSTTFSCALSSSSCIDGLTQRGVECWDRNTETVVEFTLCEDEMGYAPTRGIPCQQPICESNDDCSGGRGVCKLGKCKCGLGTTGERCEITTDEVKCESEGSEGSEYECCFSGVIGTDGCCSTGKLGCGS